MSNSKPLISYFSTSRADFGIVKELLLQLDQSPGIEVEVIVSGSHFLANQGHSFKEVEKHRFKNLVYLPSFIDGPGELVAAKSTAVGLSALSDHWRLKKPSLLVLLGDRFELFSAIVPALLTGIPVAHLHGGEVTNGAIDNKVRNAISQCANYHFTATRKSAIRLIKAGIDADTVFAVGSLSAEKIKRYTPKSVEELEQELRLSLSGDFVVVSFHPQTISSLSPELQINRLIEALRLSNSDKVIFSAPNVDPGGDLIQSLINQACEANPGWVVRESMGYDNYVSMLHHSELLIGNSSSGIIEAPIVGLPVVNVGERQRGRESSKLVHNCSFDSGEIRKSINRAKRTRRLMTRGPINIQNSPYEIPGTLNAISLKLVEIAQRSHKGLINK